MRFPTTAIFLILLPASIQVMAQGFDDEFDSYVLKSGWSWLREDRPYWQLTGTAMRITTQPGALNGPDYNDVRNILLQDAPSGDFRMDTRLIFTPDSIFHNAGLIYRLDDDNYVRVSRGRWDSVNGLWLEWEYHAVTDFIFVTNDQPDTVILRMSCVGGKTFRASYTRDGNTWVRIGETTVPFDSGKAQIGIQAANGRGVLATTARIPATFDYFRLIIGEADRTPVAPAETPTIESVYPNPVHAGGEFSLVCTFPRTGTVVIRLTDALGREIKRDVSFENAGRGEKTLSLSGVAPGVYFISLHEGMRGMRRTLVVH
ncbi:MAG: DUF1349 domain-containing protein [Bacteroidota bacterium]|nr:DUF1349 domain-containing protein [Bacteroidota bacterium]